MKKKGTKKKVSAKKKAKKGAVKKKTKKAAPKKKNTAKKRASSAKKTSAKTKKATAKTKNTVTGGSAKTRAARQLVAKLRDAALSYPDTREDFPWDHLVVKVGKKVFIFLDRIDVVEDSVRFTVKLPHSNGVALALPFATPTGYGMARSGWVSFSFPAKDAPPLSVMREWLDESYRAIAPKRKIAELDAR